MADAAWCDDQKMRQCGTLVNVKTCSVWILCLVAGCGSSLSASSPTPATASIGPTAQVPQPCNNQASDAAAQPNELAYLGLEYLFEPKNKAPTHGITFSQGAYAIATLNNETFVPARLPSNSPPLQFIALSDLQRIVDQDAVKLSNGVKHLSLRIIHIVGSSIASVRIGSDICLPSNSQLFLSCCCSTTLYFERTCAGWISVQKPWSACA